jgi:hypothetical protein
MIRAEMIQLPECNYDFLKSNKVRTTLHLQVVSVRDLVSQPITLDRFSYNSIWETFSKTVGQFRLSDILIYNKIQFA